MKNIMSLKAYQKMFEKLVEQPLEESRRKDGICAKCPLGYGCERKERSDECMRLLFEVIHYYC